MIGSSFAAENAASIAMFDDVCDSVSDTLSGSSGGRCSVAWPYARSGRRAVRGGYGGAGAWGAHAGNHRRPRRIELIHPPIASGAGSPARPITVIRMQYQW